MDTAIDRLFLPCRGALLYSASARTDLQGGGLRVRERSTPGYPTHHSPSFELIREVPAGINPKGKGGLGPSPLALRVVARSGDTTHLYRMRIRRGRNAELDVFQSPRTKTMKRGSRRLVFPRGGSAKWAAALSRHSPEPFKYFIINLQPTVIVA